MAARLFLGHTPDKLGGAKVALVCVFVEAAGLVLIWFAPNFVLAAAGAALTGFGYSLVYPGLGVEGVRRAPRGNRRTQAAHAGAGAGTASLGQGRRESGAGCRSGRGVFPYAPMHRAPPQSRGLAMGAYTVFLDVALGFGSPALGLLAGWKGLGSVFLASAIVVLGAAVVAAWLLHSSRRPTNDKKDRRTS